MSGGNQRGFYSPPPFHIPHALPPTMGDRFLQAVSHFVWTGLGGRGFACVGVVCFVSFGLPKVGFSENQVILSQVGSLLTKLQINMTKIAQI